MRGPDRHDLGLRHGGALVTFFPPFTALRISFTTNHG